MKTKKLLSIAIIAALPFGAIAENISGAMYAAPAHADTNHPAPTTGANAPYGRIDIDTADQDHIASTAYVKGAYNSAIAAVNFMDSHKQPVLVVDNLAQNGVSSLVLTSLDDISDENELVNGMAVKDAIEAQRVTVYTTWEDDTDNGTIKVTLSTAD